MPISACIAATVRLSTTITFSHEDDRMYYIAPLLFWACAEMTCGFFILGLPCVPALIKGSGLRDTIGNFLGLSLGSSNDRSRTHRDRPTQTSSHLPITAMKSEPVRRDLCSQLYNEEDGLQLYTLEDSESQERLRVEKFEVRREIRTTITSHPSCSDCPDVPRNQITPWSTPTEYHEAPNKVRNYSRTCFG